MAGSKGVWIPVNASMKGFVAEIVKQASGAAERGSKTLEAGFRKGGVDAGKAAASGLSSQASQVERASRQLSQARSVEAVASSNVLAAETKLETLRKNSGASATQIARAEQQLFNAKNQQSEAASRVARGEKELDTIRNGGQGTAQRLLRAEDQLAQAKLSAQAAAGKVKIAELEINDARAKVSQRSENVSNAEAKLIQARSRYGDTSKQAASAEKQLETAQRQAATAEGQLAAATGRAVKARADLANATENVKAKALSHKAVQADVANAERNVGNEAAVAEVKIRGLGGAMSNAATSGGNMVMGLGSIAKKAALAGGAILGVQSAGSVLSAGFERLNTLQKADIMFQNMGMSGEEVSTVMADLNKAVSGTSVSMADASSTASMLMQAGVEAGEPLNDSIKALTNISAIAGGSAQDVGMVLMQIKAAGKLMGGDALQLQGRGINIYGYLAESLGKSFEDVKKMGEDGKITYEMVIDAVNSKTGELAKQMGETLPAKMGNFKTAIASMGASILEPLMAPMTAVVSSLTQGVKSITPMIRSFVDTSISAVSALVSWLGDRLAPAWDVVKQTWGATIGWVKDAVSGLWDLVFKGDYTGSFFDAFGLEADSKVVDFILDIRDKFMLVTSAWEELTVAFRGGDWEYGALASIVGEGTADSIITVIANLGIAVRALRDKVVELAPVIRDLLLEAWQKLQPVLDTVASIITGTLVKGFEILGTVVGGVWDVLAWGTDTIYNLVHWFQQGGTGVDIFKAAVMGIGGAIGAAMLPSLAGHIMSIGLQAGRAAIQLASMGAGAVVSALMGVKNAVMGVAGAMRAMTMAMLANPITLIIAAVTGLGVALWAFFTKTETGRELWNKFTSALSDGWQWFTQKLSDGWQWVKTTVWEPFVGFITGTLVPLWNETWGYIQGAWDKFTGALSWAWGSIIKPTFDAIWKVAQFTIGVIGTAILAPLIVQWKVFSTVIKWGWENVVKPTWDFMTKAGQWLADKLAQGWQWIQEAWDITLNAMKWAWENIAKPTWDFMGKAAEWLADKITELCQWMKQVWETTLDAIKWAWENVLKPTWDAIASAAQWLRDNVLIPAFEMIKTVWETALNSMKWAWENILKPTWDMVKNTAEWLWNAILVPAFNGIKTTWETALNGMKWVWETILYPTFEKMKEGVNLVKTFFDRAVDGIRTTWDKLRGILAKPINFMINVVYNGGIRKAWNTMSSFLPAIGEAPEIGGIPEYATGGRITGPGTGTSDDVLMWGSNGEHMVTAAEVQAAGGHGAIYALRALIASGTPFSWDGGQFFKDNKDSINAYGNAVAAKGINNVPTNGLFSMLPAYKDGGEIRPAWELQLENGHKAAQARNGNPYTWGHEDCSGYMSMIADAIINGGMGVRRWGTSSFPGGQPWVPGLGQGFSVGVHDNPGGPGGGHTSGTLSGVGSYSTVNVESGGAHGYVAYGGPAAGADSPQWDGVSPGRFHLAIGADGAFESGGAGGGPSPETMRSGLNAKVMEIIDSALSPAKEGMPQGSAQWFDIPPEILGSGKDALIKAAFAAVAALGDKLRTAYEGAKNMAVNARESVGNFLNRARTNLFDTGGVLEHGAVAVNQSGKPEAVLTNSQWEDVSNLARHFPQLVPSLEAIAKDGPRAWNEQVAQLEHIASTGDSISTGISSDSETITPLRDAANLLYEMGQGISSMPDPLQAATSEETWGSIAHGTVSGHLEDAAGVFGIPTQKPAWLEAAGQFSAGAKQAAGSMAAEQKKMVDSFHDEVLGGASVGSIARDASSFAGTSGDTTNVDFADSSSPEGIDQGSSFVEETASSAGIDPAVMETAGQGGAYADSVETQMATQLAGIMGATSTLELGRTLMHAGIDTTAMGAKSAVSAAQEGASALLNGGVGAAQSLLNGGAGGIATAMNAVVPGAGAALAPVLAAALPAAQSVLSTAIPVGEMAINAAGWVANTGIDQVAGAAGRMTDAGFDTVEGEVPNMPLPGEALGKLPEAALQAKNDVVGGASEGGQSITGKNGTANYVFNVGDRSDAMNMYKKTEGRELAGFGVLR